MGVLSSTYQAVEQKTLRTPDFATIIISAAFWSWAMLAILRPTFFLTSSSFYTDSAPFEMFRGITIVVCTATFLAYAAHSEELSKILDLKFWEWLFIGLAALGGLLTVAGATLESLASYALIIFGAGLIGVSTPYFILEWCRMYIHRGLRTCMSCISGSLALSFVISTLVPSFDAPICIGFVIAMPVLIGVALRGIRSLAAYSPSAQKQLQFNRQEAYGAAAIFNAKTDSKDRAEEIPNPQPFGFLVSIILAGISFGCAQESLFGSIISASFILISFIVGAVLLFLCSYYWPSMLKAVLGTYLILGIAGCLAPAISILSQSSPSVYYAMAALGFIAYLVVLLSLTSCFASKGTAQSVRTTAFNLALFAIGTLCGLGITLVLTLAGISFDDTATDILAGFTLMIAAFFIVDTWSLPLVRIANTPQNIAQTPTVPSPQDFADCIGDAYGLTKREREIFAYLIMGRSRPRIAETLCLSENTVNSHIRHIYEKTSVANVQELLDLVYLDDNSKSA